MSHHHIDITDAHCPMTFVRVKLKLEAMVSGETLTVRLNAGEPLKNVPRSLLEEGYHVGTPYSEDSTKKQNNIFLLDVAKM